MAVLINPVGLVSWFHEMFPKCTHLVTSPDQGPKHWTTPVLHQPQPWFPHPSKENHDLLSNVTDSNLSFLKTEFLIFINQEIFISCHPLKSQIQQPRGIFVPCKQHPVEAGGHAPLGGCGLSWPTWLDSFCHLSSLLV